jgi:activator of 2-hydroxyglutaryl-CoA dehydratase/predicted nucleotide-binding protein (sugar kinase/HSP70/actin superfamily)
MTGAPRFRLGLDVGSTAVKLVAERADSGEVVWTGYERHESRPAEKAADMLERLERDLGLPPDACEAFTTGSAGQVVAEAMGARHVQEVAAIALAVERRHPDTRAVIELGGHDAKMILFEEEGGRRRTIVSMNDKCAGGTGAVIDKLSAKLGIARPAVGDLGYAGRTLYPIAGKCGVFAETDINSLQKRGVPADDLMASLFDAIVLQNLSVLARGHTLRPRVLLLGGPNAFIRGLREAWRARIGEQWRERDVPLPEGMALDEAVLAPPYAAFFGAIGAIEFGRRERDAAAVGYRGAGALAAAARTRPSGGRRGVPALAVSGMDLAAFRAAYERPAWSPPRLPRGGTARGFVGLDAGSTSTKAVLLDEDGQVLAKAYQLSRGNPIEDGIDMFRALRGQVAAQGADLEVLGLVTTGYAKDILKEVFGADAALVETVAHAQSALQLYRDPHVIVDVGGQDIKIVVLREGRVKDFRLNTQCSAGNGYFLQAIAQSFGCPVERFAEAAFAAREMPVFSYGCVLFLQAELANVQRHGWTPEEVLAGLAAVLPRNVFLYVAKAPNLARLGTRFVLQGGTQRNLAAVKAQVDFIRESFAGQGREPEILLHAHCGEAGAIGAALEAARLWREGRRTSFIGLDEADRIQYRTWCGEETRCRFCQNACLRTFIDVWAAAGREAAAARVPADRAAGPAAGTGRPAAPDRAAGRTGAPPAGAAGARAGRAATAGDLAGDGGAPGPSAAARACAAPEPRGDLASGPADAGGSPGEERTAAPVQVRRLIVAGCEKGSVEDVGRMRRIKAELDAAKAATPDLVALAAREAFRPPRVPAVADPLRWAWTPRARARRRLAAARDRIRIGVPRVFYLYAYAPLFAGYLQSLGIRPAHIVYSDYTSAELYRAGATRGAIDPCFPSKVALAHVHNLLFVKHRRAPLAAVFFPMIDVLPARFVARASNACPTVALTPQSVRAALTKEGDVFAELGVRYLAPLLDLENRDLFRRQMFDAWRDVIGLSWAEHERAIEAGWAAQADYEARVRQAARQALDTLERQDRIGIVLLGRPYHHDPGLNHGIAEELQKLGYPVFSQSTLPFDADLLERLFGEEVRAGVISSPFDITDAWKNALSASSNAKIWAAKFTARHPNLVGVELSNFKCGHDAPIYSTIEGIIEASGTPYFAFKDLDENRPSGSIKLRLETIDYALKRYREQMLRRRRLAARVERWLAEYERRLLADHDAGPPAAAVSPADEPWLEAETR